MLTLTRHAANPILRPRYEVPWESSGSFNGSVAAGDGTVHMVYRGQSVDQAHDGFALSLSTVGYASSRDGVSFTDRRQLIVPEHPWEQFGCEDPRVTLLGGTYFICYTALSTYPYTPQGIKVAVALTRDFATLDERHAVTPFNSKAMALFPQLIDGGPAAVLTAHTDMPPAKIALARFREISDLWSPEYWEEWYARLDAHVLPLLRSPMDQVEVGAQPVETDDGWLLVYSEIRDYLRGAGRVFGIQAALLDRDDPSRVVARTERPLLVPEAPYEMLGFVPRVSFPSGALLRDGRLDVYYGAADTSVALAGIELESLLAELRATRAQTASLRRAPEALLTRFEGNPVIAPRAELAWEARGTFNPAAVQFGDDVHLLYRALGTDDRSVLGYAVSRNGLVVDERPTDPAYGPREPFESSADGGCGCEDPRLTLLEGRLYLLYTAYNGHDARVALSSIAPDDFCARRWEGWERPILVSAPEVWDKDACLFPRKIDGRFAVLHRLSVAMWIDFAYDLGDLERHWLGGSVLLAPRPDHWDNRKVGACGPPIETEDGWLLLYHGITEPGSVYSVGGALLDRDDPTVVLARTPEPIFTPQTDYESRGVVNNVVFPCGTALRGRDLYVYYGGADRVVGVAVGDLDRLVRHVASYPAEEDA
jgi:predicted GH43/DUF377 family glycosyl hydrolase